MTTTNMIIGISTLACMVTNTIFWFWGYRLGSLLHRTMPVIRETAYVEKLRAELDQAREHLDLYWDRLVEAQSALEIVRSPSTTHQEAREVATAALIRQRRCPSPSEGEG